MPPALTPMRPLGTKYVVLVLCVAAGWGAFVRLWNVGARPFWRDEAWVATALRDLSYGELMGQTGVPVPPLFAVTAKLSGQVVQPPELGYRLPAGIWGVLVVPLVYATARTLRAPRTLALGAAGLAASCLMLVIWSREAKQYSFEGFVSVLIALLTFRARRARAARELRLLGVAIALVCLVAPWYGYGAVFPIISVLPLLLILKPVSGARRRGICVAAAGLLGLVIGVAGVWAVAARGQAAAPALAKFAALWYPDPLVLRSWVHIAGYAAVTSHVFFFPADWCLPVRTEQDRLCLALLVTGVWLLTLIGLVAWPRTGRFELACWVCGPWLTMFAAGLAHCYPFAIPRMMQFCAPPIVLAATAGVVVLARGLCHVIGRRGGPALITLMFLGALPGVYVVRHTWTHCYGPHQDFPAALRLLQEQRRPGELVFVDLTAAPCVQYYAPDLLPPIIAVPTCNGTLCPAQVDERSLARRSAMIGGPRFWILYVDEPRGSLHTPSLEVIRKWGYTLEVVASCGGGTDSAGSAEVLLARRR